MSGTVKMKDIADRLGVSVMTVSNALSGKKGVSASVRDEIMTVAEEMGYDTSKYKKNEEKGARIGVIASRRYLEIGTSFYWALYQQVVYAASRKDCFTLIEIIEEEANLKGQLPKMLMDESVDGIIILGCLEHCYIRRILAAAQVPVVLLDFYDESCICDAVMSNSYMGAYRVTRYLLQRGHRDIAFVGSVLATDNIMNRYFGYRKAMEEMRIPIKDEWVLEDRDLRTGDIRINLPHPMPTAFVCNSDLTAGRLYDELYRNGYRVPDDISVVGYDNYIYGHPLTDKLTTYNVDMELMAREAVKILLKKRKNPDRHKGVLYIDGGIIERSSVKSLQKK